MLAIAPTIIPKGAKNVDAAKALLRDFIQPANLNAYLKETRARYLPVMASIVKNDPYWTDPKDPHRPVAVDMGLIKPTVPWWMSYNPAYSAVLSEQIWPQAEANITQKQHDPGTGHRGSGQTDQAAVRAVSEMTAAAARPVRAGCHVLAPAIRHDIASPLQSASHPHGIVAALRV